MARTLKPPKGAQHAGAIERLDAAVGATVARYHKTRLIRTLAAVGNLADQPPLIAASVVTIACGAVLRDRRLVRVGGRMLASELVATAIKAAIKHRVTRSRPRTMLKHGRYTLERDRDGDHDAGPWNSFPSGHTAGAVAVARAISRDYPAAAPVAACAAGFAALIQVPGGAHFPSDVAAGAAIGLASEALVPR